MRASRCFAASILVLGCTPTAGIGYNPAVDASAADVGVSDVLVPQDVVTAPDVADAPPGADLPALPDAPAPPDVATLPDVAPAPDVVTVPDVPTVTDVPPSGCMANRDCPGGACDRVTNRCVRCLTSAECGGATPVCASRNCVAATACVSSRMCPGQVCDTAAGRCVDCVTDPDCPTGSVCRNRGCVAPPAPCMSSRQCSPFDQVCDTARGVCVDCVSDPDCPMGQFCTTDRVCAPQVCAPNSATCADARTRRVCAANGSGTSDMTCGAGTGCRDGACATQTCRPGAQSCASGTARQVCNDDGFSQTTTPCAAASNANPLCANNLCGIVCVTGFGDCDSNAANGCETDLNATIGSCGSCGRACNSANGTARCASGVCAITCSAGFADCDNSATNGCETSTLNSALNCGMCGRACAGVGAPNTAAGCSAGTCTYACTTGFSDCDGSTSNGCETNIQSSPAHCGGCNRACGTGQLCSAGSCVESGPFPSMLTARHGVGVAVTPDGTLYAVGGQGSSSVALATVESWSPLTNTWSTRAPLPRGVWSPGVVTGRDGRVYAVGGRDINGNATSAVYIYDAARNAWDTGPSMNTTRHSHAVAVTPSGNIFALSGRTGTTTITTAAEFLDQTSGMWRTLPPIPNGVSSARAIASNDGRVWVFGGINGTALSTIQIYNPALGSWSLGPSMPYARYGMAVTRVGDTAYIAGGDSSSQLVLPMYSLNMSNQQGSTLASLPFGRLYLGLAALLDGRIVAVGGSTSVSASTYLSTVSAYTPATNTWR